MLEQKAFLAAACENVSQLLDGVLRYDYAEHIDQNVFSTLQTRIAHVHSKLATAEIAGISALASDLSGIARNISQIERSHLGEFSWVFMEHFKTLADKTCAIKKGASLIGDTRSNAASETSHPLGNYEQVYFFYSSNSELEQYQLIRNKNDAGGARIFSLLFPRAQKHSVLMHGLLAHELGHALTSLDSRRWDALIRQGFSNTPLAWPDDGLSPNTSSDAPEAFHTWSKNLLSSVEKPNVVHLKKITEELFCDLIGLLLFGPAFVFALAQNLWALDPLSLGKKYLPEYPPFHIRIAMLVAAMDILNWKSAISTKAISSLKEKISGTYSVAIQKSELENLLSSIKNNLPADTVYTSPVDSVLTSVKQDLKLQVPPRLQSLQKDPDTYKITILPLEKLDFRDVILAGWEAYFESEEYGAKDIQKAAERFVLINKLCEKALANMLAFKGMQKVKP